MRLIAEFIYNRFNIMIPYIRFIDILQIFLITIVLYNVILWLRNTKAWNLLKGILILLLFYVAAAVLNMTVIVWLVNNCLSVVIMVFVIVFQPEFRQALERLGSNMGGGNGSGFFARLLPIDIGNHEEENRFTKQTVMEILNAVFSMASVKTGALIVIQNTMPIVHYVQRWGTDIDAIVGSELLINIFEKDTPLHDGAVVIIGNRIASAKCFLPLNEMEGISSRLGTRHHAAAGISEITDSVTVIVSEQTGRVSVARDGKIKTNLDRKSLEKELLTLCTEEKPQTSAKSVWKRNRQRQQ
ncbi:MAG: diadenylate cyclase CdaA [Lachnospiraceae bacterium]|nr:diadenylate cyclase CdaA [Lachnospiraceae bacterium]MDY4969399.1 diadenylate cyclase CdaA [Lachnospiraceae bacterium]